MTNNYLICGTFASDMEYLYKLRQEYHNLTDEDDVSKFCNILNIHPFTLSKRSRKQHIVRIRRLFVNYSSRNSVELGKLLNLHHSTVLHLRKTHESCLMYDKAYKRLWKELF